MNRHRIFRSILVIALFLTMITFCFAHTDLETDNRNTFQMTNLINMKSNAIPGYCNADGVKFKASPDANGTTLGLCYKNETLYKQAPPAGTPSSWIYVYRPKTGQYGYIVARYFSLNPGINSILR